MKTPPRVTNKERKEEKESKAQLPEEGSLRRGRLESPKADGRRQALREATSDMSHRSQDSGDRNLCREDSGRYHPGSRPPGPLSMERRLGGSSLTQQSSSQPRYYSPFDRLRPDYSSSSLGRSSGSRDSPTLSGGRDERPLGSYDYQDGGGPEKTSSSIGRSLRSMTSPLYSSDRERGLASRVFVNPSFCSSALLSDHERRVGIFADRKERPLHSSSFPSGQPRFATYTDLDQHHRSSSAPRGREDEEWSATSLRQDRPSSSVGPGQSYVGASRNWDLEMDDVPFRRDEEWRAPSETRHRPSGLLGPGERSLGMGEARRADRELMPTSAGRERPDPFIGRSGLFNSSEFECKERTLDSRDLEQQRLPEARRFRVPDEEDPVGVCQSQRPRASLLGEYQKTSPEFSSAALDKQFSQNSAARMIPSGSGPGYFESVGHKQLSTNTFQEKIPPCAGQGPLLRNPVFPRAHGGEEVVGNPASAQKLAGPGPSLGAIGVPGSGNHERRASVGSQDSTLPFVNQVQGQRFPDPKIAGNVEGRPATLSFPVKLPIAASQGQGPQCTAIPAVSKNQGMPLASAYPPNYTGQRNTPAGTNVLKEGLPEHTALFAGTAPPSMRQAVTPLGAKCFANGEEQKALPTGYPIHSATSGNEAQFGVVPGFNQTTSQVRPEAAGYHEQLTGPASAGQLQYNPEKVEGKGPVASSQAASDAKEGPGGAATFGTSHDRPLQPPPGLLQCLNFPTGTAEIQLGPTKLTDGSTVASNVSQDKEAYKLPSPSTTCPNITNPSYQSWFPPSTGQAQHAAAPVSISSTSPQGGQEQCAATAVQGKLPNIAVTPPVIPPGIPPSPPCHMQQSPQGPQISFPPGPLQYPLPGIRYPPPARPASQRPPVPDVADPSQHPSSVPNPRSAATSSYLEPRFTPTPFCSTPGQAPFGPTGNQERYRFPPPFMPGQPRIPIPGNLRQPSLPTPPLSATTGGQLQSLLMQIMLTLPVLLRPPGTGPESVGPANQQSKPSDSVSIPQEQNKISPSAKAQSSVSDKPEGIALLQGEVNVPKQKSKVYGPEVPGCSIEIIENSTDTDNSSDVEVIEVNEGAKTMEEAVKASTSEVGASLNTGKEPTKGPEVKAQKISIQLQEPLLMKQEACAKKQEALFKSQISANKSFEIEAKKQEAGSKNFELATKIQPVVGKKKELQGNNQNREILKGNRGLLQKGKKPIIAIKPITEMPKPVEETQTPITEITKAPTEIEKPSTEIPKALTEVQKASAKQEDADTIFYGPSVKGHQPISKSEEAPVTTQKVGTADVEETKGEETLPKNTDSDKRKEENPPKGQDAAKAEEQSKATTEKVVASEKEPALMNQEVSSSTPEGVIAEETKEPEPISSDDDRREEPKDGKVTDEDMETASSSSYTESSESEKSERYSFKKSSKSRSRERSHKKSSRKKHKTHHSSYEESESEDDHEVENRTDGVCLSGRGNDGQVFGIPVVFKAIGTTRTFWNIRASQVSREIEEVVGDVVINQKINRAGFLCVNVATAGDAPDATLPRMLELGPDRFIVEEYIEAPMQCFKCLRFGHTARNCVSVSRCKNCGARYCQEECERKTPLCANCFGPHQATYVGCPRRREVAFASLWRRTYDIHAL
ncbi:hypothetical protein HPB48_022844 [Haemaphysalis longicornis]|uniref:CCHC-type domain-containing protein n=1 Tax=Haemaphysalis longicornis TaxID=44386 RepID=A0A9J6FP48_HAELO|nr:hypothetical protein HPB48_022844 [Haemaphysalis longicornis]